MPVSVKCPACQFGLGGYTDALWVATDDEGIRYGPFCAVSEATGAVRGDRDTIEKECHLRQVCGYECPTCGHVWMGGSTRD